MRPYFAIIKDSFRAALASRVLYILLALITILLVLLAPFYLREELDWKIQFGSDIRNISEFSRQVVDRKDDPKYPYVARVWEMLPAESQEQLQKIYTATEGESSTAAEVETNVDEPAQRRRGRRGRPRNGGPPPDEDVFGFFGVINSLNELMEDRDFYRPEDWEGQLLSSEAEALVELGPSSLTDAQSRRLNRLLLVKAFPTTISSGDKTTLDFYYGFWKLDFASGVVTRAQFQTVLSSSIPWFFDKFVLSIGLLIAILVTASIIPETFEPGSLNLLLSKPISRTGLFLTKFLGGCTFVALCSTYLFLGTWLWLGIGMGIWDRSFLWSIPLYILVFMIYYSVSALIGLTFRSTIMAIVVTGLFWAFCSTVGVTYGFLRMPMANSKVIAVTAGEDQLAVVNSLGHIRGWDEKDKSWVNKATVDLMPEQRIAEQTAMWLQDLREDPVRLPPLYDPQAKRFYSGVDGPLAPFDMFEQDFLVAGLDLKFQKIGKFPRDAMAAFLSDDGLLVVTSGGRFLSLDRADIESTWEQAKKLPLDENGNPILDEGGPQKPSSDDAEPEDTETTDLEKPESDQSAISSLEDLVEDLTPESPIGVREPYHVAYSQAADQVAIFAYREGQHLLYLFGNNGERYEQLRSTEVDTGAEGRMECLVAYQGDTIVLVAGNGQIVTYSQQLEDQLGYRPETKFAIEEVTGSPDGRWFAFRYADGRVWLLDTENEQTVRLANVVGQGEISSVSFDQQNQLWVADRTDRVIGYQPADMSRVDTKSPSGGIFERAFRYVVRPVYTICPKPSEFYKVVTFLSKTDDVETNLDTDLTRASKSEDPFLPLWSGLGFMLLMLTVGCTIFHFKDY